MHFFIYYIIFLFLNPEFYDNIEQKNRRVSEFNQAVETQDFKKAVGLFELIDALHRDIDADLRLVAAHSYFQLGDTLRARQNYEIVKDINEKSQSSVAWNQLGVLALDRGDSTQALNYFKKSIERNGELSEAKFNFELIAKLHQPTTGASPLAEFAEITVEVSHKREEELEDYTSENISKERALQLLDNLRISEKRGLISGRKSDRKVEKDW